MRRAATLRLARRVFSDLRLEGADLPTLHALDQLLIDFAITHPPVCSSLSRSLLCPPADGRASGMTRCSVRTALTAPAAGARACLD